MEVISGEIIRKETEEHEVGKKTDKRGPRGDFRM